MVFSRSENIFQATPLTPFKVVVCAVLMLFCSVSCGGYKTAGHNKRIPEVFMNRGSSKKVGQPILGYFRWPLNGELGSGFGLRDGRPHTGIDIRSPEGTPIRAAADGEVSYVGRFASYGKLILLKHANGYFTLYAHNSENLVKEGKSVKQGDVIAKVGNTGNATGYHLHFEIREGSNPSDPLLSLEAR